MMKRWVLRLFFVVVIAAAVGAAVALNDQKRRMAEMSDDELRAYLGRKLEGRVPPEKLEQIQDKVTAAVRSGRASVGDAPLSSNGGVSVDAEAGAEAVVEVAVETADSGADGDADDASGEADSDDESA